MGLLQGSVLAGFCGKGHTDPALHDPTASVMAPPKPGTWGLLPTRVRTWLEPRVPAAADPLPLQACSWPVSTLRISLTHAALTSGVGACAGEEGQEVRMQALKTPLHPLLW